MGNNITMSAATKKAASIGRIVAQPIRRRGIRIPEVAIGLAIITASIALFALLGRGADEGRRVLVLRSDLGDGQVVDATDLGVVEISASEGLTLLPDTAATELVGMRATSDLLAGTPLSGSQFTDVVPLSRSEGLVGLVVAPQQAPLDLHPGDEVSVVVVDQTVDGLATVTPLTFSASVWSVSIPDGSTSERSVALRVPLGSASLIMGHDELHLVKVGG